MINEELHFEAFAALQTLRSSGDTADSQSPGLFASQIVAYARRGDAIVDLKIERVLRSSAGARDLYSAALGRVVRASSMSVAAAADRVTERQIGRWHLEIVEEADGLPWLVIRGPEAGDTISMMEIRRPDGTGRRLHLGTPIDKVFQVPLDPGFAEMAGLIEWLRDPSTEIHLI
jgi:hypothetical protein